MKKLTKKTTTVDSSEKILDDIEPEVEEARGEGEDEDKGDGDGDGDGEVGFPGVYPLM